MNDSEEVAWICPKIGCMKTIKAPFKHGKFIQNPPVCPVHKIKMIGLEENIMNALKQMHSFVYDQSILPPEDLIQQLPSSSPES
jgi:hypothetical protein